MIDKNFKRFLISYILVLFIPLAITIYSYSRATDIIERNIIESNIFKLSNFRDILDNKLAMIDRVVLELNFNERLQRVIHQPFPHNSPDMYYFYTFFQDFNRFSIYSVLEGDESFLFLRNNNIVYGRGFFGSNLQDFYGEFFKFGDTTYEEFGHLLFDRRYYARFMPAENVTFLNRKGLYIPLLFSMPAITGTSGYDTTRVWGSLLYLLNVDEIHRLMAGSLDVYGGETFILEGDSILTSTGSLKSGLLDLNIDRTGGVSVSEVMGGGSLGGKTLAIYIPSEYTTLSFLTLLPLDVIRSDMNLLRNTIIILLAAALIIGLVISVVLSYRNTVPITRLLSSNRDLQERLREQRQYMGTLYIDKMLNNNLTSAGDLEMSLKQAGLDFDDNRYRVILVRIMPSGFIPSDANIDDWDIYQAFFRNLAAPQYVVHTLNRNELVIIASFKNENDIQPVIRNMQDEFNRQFGFIPFCGIGEEYGSPAEIHNSMQEAASAVDYTDILEKTSYITWFRDITAGNTFGLFGKDQEQALFNFICQGNQDALIAHLDGIYSSVQYQGLSANKKQLYLAQLHTILLRLSVDVKIDVDFREIEKQSAGDHKHYFISLREAYLNLCDRLKGSKKSRKTKLKESILAYINERFGDAGLNVAMMASHFNVAENYFSQFFSEQIGEPFSRYLEKVRIEHACKLLADITMTVDNVALQSGYYNTNTFRRAFKRVMGTTPSDYAKI